MNIPFLKKCMPWPVKIIAKMILARLPASYNFLEKNRSVLARGNGKSFLCFSIYETHYARVGFPRKGNGFVSLELDPGDSLFSALISFSFGGSASFLVDVGSYAVDSLEPYYLMAKFLHDNKMPVPLLQNCKNLEEYLEECNSTYLINGISSLRGIPDSSVDFIWSNTVLEHIRKKDFLPLLHELRRILRPDGICSDRIDLRDHLSSALNNLRFSDKLWESDFFIHQVFIPIEYDFHK